MRARMQGREENPHQTWMQSQRAQNAEAAKEAQAGDVE